MGRVPEKNDRGRPAFTPSLTSENLVSPGSPGEVIDQTSPESACLRRRNLSDWHRARGALRSCLLLFAAEGEEKDSWCIQHRNTP